MEVETVINFISILENIYTEEGVKAWLDHYLKSSDKVRASSVRNIYIIESGAFA